MLRPPLNISVRPALPARGRVASAAIESLAMWSQVGTNALEDVAPSGGSTVLGVLPVAGLMAAYSGGAFDSTTGRLLIFGGGHSDSADNAVYAFLKSNLTWSKLSTCAANAIISASTEADGYYAVDVSGEPPDLQQPTSRHTYNFLQWLPTVGKFVAIARLASYPNAGGGTEFNLFDPATGLWSQGTPSVTAFDEYALSCVDTSGNLWFYGGSASACGLAKYTPGTDSWTNHGDGFNYGGAFSGSAKGTGVYDSVNNFMWGVGGGTIGYWDLNGGGLKAFNPVTSSGVQTLQDAAYPGLDWDPIKSRIVGWAGGSGAFAFNVTTHAWSTITLDPSNAVTPTSAPAAGTYGRFRYAGSGQFICVNATDESVYILTPGAA